MHYAIHNDSAAIDTLGRVMTLWPADDVAATDVGEGGAGETANVGVVEAAAGATGATGATGAAGAAGAVGAAGAAKAAGASGASEAAARQGTNSSTALGRAGPAIIVVTVATEDGLPLRQLRATVESAGYLLVVLGLGKVYTNPGFKLDQVARFLDGRIGGSGGGSDGGGGGGGGGGANGGGAWPVLEDDTLILFVDAYDVLLLPPAKTELLARFASLNSPLVVSAENTCWPDVAVSLVWPPRPSSSSSSGTGDISLYQFANTGGYMGYAWALRRAYRWLRARWAGPGQWPPNDDQRAFQTLMLEDVPRPFFVVEAEGMGGRGGEWRKRGRPKGPYQRGQDVVLDYGGAIFGSMFRVNASGFRYAPFNPSTGAAVAAVAAAMSAEGGSSTETTGVETMVLPNLEAPPCVAHFHGGRITKALYQRVAQDLACRGWGLPSSVEPAQCHSEGGGGGEESGGRTVLERGG